MLQRPCRAVLAILLLLGGPAAVAAEPGASWRIGSRRSSASMPMCLPRRGPPPISARRATARAW